MIARATTKVSILRGTSTDAYGDAQSATTVASSGIIASILPVNRRVFVPSSQRWETARGWAASLPHGTDVQLGDRLRDSANQTFVVDTFITPPNPAIAMDIRLELRRVDT